jgi:hypothetical protein
MLLTLHENFFAEQTSTNKLMALIELQKAKFGIGKIALTLLS